MALSFMCGNVVHWPSVLRSLLRADHVHDSPPSPSLLHPPSHFLYNCFHMLLVYPPYAPLHPSIPYICITQITTNPHKSPSPCINIFNTVMCHSLKPRPNQQTPFRCKTHWTQQHKAIKAFHPPSFLQAPSFHYSSTTDSPLPALPSDPSPPPHLSPQRVRQWRFP